MDIIGDIRLALEKKISWVAHFDDLSPLTSELDSASWASLRDSMSLMWGFDISTDERWN